MSSKVLFKLDCHKDGAELSPENMPLGDLAYVLEQFSKALAAMAKAKKKDTKKLRISLTEIRAGSCTAVLDADTTYAGFSDTLVKAIQGRDSTKIPRSARESLYKIHSRTRSRGWTFGIQNEVDKIASGGVDVTPDDILFEKPITLGASSVVATIIKAGGDKSRLMAQLRTPDQNTFTAKVKDMALAKQLGELLYQQVELKGTAVWNTKDWSLSEFLIESIGTYHQQESDPVSALDELRESSQGFWDNKDISGYLDTMRGGGEVTT